MKQSDLSKMVGDFQELSGKCENKMPKYADIMKNACCESPSGFCSIEVCPLIHKEGSCE